MSDANRLRYAEPDEPSPLYATAADIALADALRRQLEQRYFGGGGADPPAAPAANEDGLA
ncbi:MAG: hypothetical protein U1F58_07220 [Burkholderiales bacterium]